ncbi:MAG: exodeoxyribonuclease VII large subunit, partial [Armatimonadetes bacterium]|nr:exodeoxyribonuclease VII large subunit [Armatimonadota bacterium]
MSRAYVFTVHQLTRYLRALFAQEATLQDVRVQGEISDFVHHRSGHLYFTLKDEHSQLRCVFFRQEAEALTFSPENGSNVVARGTITIYEPRGQYQLVVRELEHAGAGDLAAAFEKLKQKLAAEGLFDEDRKRSLPPFPQKIAVLTSPVGAAVHDVLTTLRARWPSADVVLIPTSVSGRTSAPEIVRAFECLPLIQGVDVVLLVRGGGSLEELAGFNAEAVARAIAACQVPVISGVGHETDVSIADLVADRRAPTPTGAGVLAAPDRRSLLADVQGFRRTAAERLRQFVERYRRELALLRARPVLSRPSLLLALPRQRLDDVLEAHRRSLRERLGRAGESL